MSTFLFLGKPKDMEPPTEYVRFTKRRRLWQELGMTPNDSHGEYEEAALFLRLEDKYAQMEKAKSAGS